MKELSAYKNPPLIIKHVLSCLAMLLDADSHFDWSGRKKYLGQVCRERLTLFDVKTVPPRVVNAIIKTYIKRCPVDTVRTASPPAATLCEWIHWQVELYKQLIVENPQLYGCTSDSAPTSPNTDGGATAADLSRPARSDSETRKLTAQDVYNQLTRPGKGLVKSVARTKLMFVGRGRSGKTSTRKTLKGEAFDSAEKSTRGASTFDICAREDVRDWTVHVPRGDEHRHATARIIARVLAGDLDASTLQERGGLSEQFVSKIKERAKEKRRRWPVGRARAHAGWLRGVGGQPVERVVGHDHQHSVAQHLGRLLVRLVQLQLVARTRGRPSLPVVGVRQSEGRPQQSRRPGAQQNHRRGWWRSERGQDPEPGRRQRPGGCGRGRAGRCRQPDPRRRR